MNHEDNNFNLRNYDVQKEKKSDVYDCAKGHPTEILEKNHGRGQDK